VRYGWQIGDIVFNLDFLSIHHSVTMKELLVSIYLWACSSAPWAPPSSRARTIRAS